MMFPRIFFAAVLLAYAPALLSSTCPGDNVIDNPAAFVWTDKGDHYSGVMEIGEASFNIGSDSITTRAYRQPDGAYSIPGPTLFMTPGEKYVLRFHNRLPYAPKSEAHNVFKDPNVSNIHTHGLHISGESPGDDVTRSFEGGYGGDFVYDIPLDHMGGTYWYHAHHHGSTFLQVSGGAFGLIIIDDGADGIPPSVAAMEEKHLVFGFLDPDAAGTGGDTLITGTLSPSWTVNGKVDGSLCLPPDTWQHWRMLVADRDAREKTITVGANCEVALMARDGVWRTTVPKALPTNSVTLTGASRADLAVRCSADSTISVDNQVVATVYADSKLLAGDPAAASPYANGISAWNSFRPAYLRDLRNESPGNFETVSMGARTINGDKWDASVPSFELHADSLQEWTVKGARQHPFHLHIYHMQMVDDCNNYEGGEYYDVIATNCNVRFDLNAETAKVYAGRTIMHCHILAHEDQGAMTWADVLGGDGPPVFPSNQGYGTYYALGGPMDPPASPTGLTASAVSSSQINLAWTDNANDEEGFDIERSNDGASFTFHATVAADTSVYADTDLAAFTTYYYRVYARNAFGNSAFSNTASATTEKGGGTGSPQVDSITLSTLNQGKGLKSGRAVVVISDGQGSPLTAASVAGYFSGTFNETPEPGFTDSNGSVTFDTAGTAKGGISLTFCVSSINGADLNLPVCNSL